MWTDKFTENELTIVNACRNGSLHNNNEEILNVIQRVISRMANILDEEASWNHSFRFREEEKEYVNPLGPDAGWLKNE
jgi:hypothetical protein